MITTNRLTNILNSFKKLVILILSIIILQNINPIYAQTDLESSTITSDSSPKEFNSSINMCPFGIAFGIYSANFEHLIQNTHGFVARADYEAIPSKYTAADIESYGYSFTFNYRYHLDKKMESLFIGFFSRYRVFKGEGKLDTEEFKFDLPDFTIGLNAGKRWVWNNGINITFSLGYGYTWESRNVDSSNPAIDKIIDDYENEYDFRSPFYGELSIGYAF